MTFSRIVRPSDGPKNLMRPGYIVWGVKTARNALDADGDGGVLIPHHSSSSCSKSGWFTYNREQQFEKKIKAVWNMNNKTSVKREQKKNKKKSADNF